MIKLITDTTLETRKMVKMYKDKISKLAEAVLKK